MTQEEENFVVTRISRISAFFAAIAFSGSSGCGFIVTPRAASTKVGTMIVGRVTFRNTGAPLNRGMVTLCHDVKPARGCISELSETQTDERGNYEFRGVPPGSYVPAVRISGMVYALNLSRDKNSPFMEAVRYVVMDGKVTRVPTIQIAQAPTKDEVLHLQQETALLISPSPGQCVGPRPTFEWRAVPGASGYLPELWRIDDPGRNGVKEERVDAFDQERKDTRMNVPDSLEDGFYRWKVLVPDATGSAGNAEQERSQSRYWPEGFFTVSSGGC